MDELEGQSATLEGTIPRRGGMVRAVLRVSLAVVGVALLIGGGISLRAGFRLRAQCREAEVAEVLNVSIDLGAAGQHHATLSQIAGFTCRQYIRMTPECREGEDAGSLLRGMELTIAVKDADGVEWMTGVFPTPRTVRDEAGHVTIAESRPMPVGEYSVVVDIVTPARSLAGRPVRFVSGYVLCGIEWMAPTVGVAGGAAAITIGTIISITLWSTRRRALGTREERWMN